MPLDQSEPKTFSQGITLQHFGIGEKVVRQGYASNALYIVVSGEAVMAMTDNAGKKYDILPLKASELFGEMTLFSGELSPISVTAVGDLEVMKISATVVNQMIERQPSASTQLKIRVGKFEKIDEVGYSDRKLYAEEVHCPINRSRT